jgi:hypothetical protein
MAIRLTPISLQRAQKYGLASAIDRRRKSRFSAFQNFGVRRGAVT